VTAATGGGPPTFVVTGRIATLRGERGYGWAEAMAIRHGRVMAVGDARGIEALAGAGTVRWRLPPDRMVLPGLTDAHLHLVETALGASTLDVSGTADLAETLRLVAQEHRRLADAGDRDGWLIGHGWSLDALDGWPTAAMLDAAAPGRPVALRSHDHHTRWASTTALLLAGVTAATPDPAGGVVRRDDRGAATGILHEAAGALLDDAIPEPDFERLARAIAAAAAALARLGVTGCHDPGELTADAELRRGPVLYGSLAATGRLPLRVHASILGAQLPAAVGAGLRSGAALAEPADDSEPAARHAARARMGWAKLFSDGAMGSRSAALLEPYADDPGGPPPVGSPSGMLLHPPDVIEARARTAVDHGIAVQIHAIGDLAVRTVLDVLGRMPGGHGGLHHRVEHAQLVHPDDQIRFAPAGIAASVQPVHIASDAAVARRVWGARSAHAFPLATLVRTGALIPFGTDAPVEAIDPWPGIGMAVLRRHPSWPPETDAFHPELGIPLERAIRAACLDPALVAGEEDRGRLIEGHRADFIVVPARPFGDPTGAGMFDVRPDATVLDGEVVFRGEHFDP
jgi:predicted amidohydrolase YtcJ